MRTTNGSTKFQASKHNEINKSYRMDMKNKMTIKKAEFFTDLVINS